jgi:hypothetical protein
MFNDDIYVSLLHWISSWYSPPPQGEGESNRRTRGSSLPLLYCLSLVSTHTQPQTSFCLWKQHRFRLSMNHFVYFFIRCYSLRQSFKLQTMGIIGYRGLCLVCKEKLSCFICWLLWSNWSLWCVCIYLFIYATLLLLLIFMLNNVNNLYLRWLYSV